MTTVDLAPPARALAIGAHPDDIEFGCAATLAKWARAGTEVYLLVLTDGSKGTWEAGDDPAALTTTREAEQRDAAAVLGAVGVTFLHLADGELQAGLAERARVCEAIRRLRPDVVLGHDPWKRYRLHPDHRHAGDLTIDAIVAARDPHFFPEQALTAHRPSTLLLFEAEEVDHLEDVAGTLEVKVEALVRHRSQWRSTMGIHDDPERQRQAFADERRRIAAEAAREHGTGLTLVEAFKRLDNL